MNKNLELYRDELETQGTNFFMPVKVRSVYRVLFCMLRRTA